MYGFRLIYLTLGLASEVIRLETRVHLSLLILNLSKTPIRVYLRSEAQPLKVASERCVLPFYSFL